MPDSMRVVRTAVIGLAEAAVLVVMIPFVVAFAVCLLVLSPLALNLKRWP